MNQAQEPPRGVKAAEWKRLSPFQQAVYLAICRIRPGQTRSYQWVARQIGRPRAARAVGNALNQNPFAPQIPCHRVVRSNGMLGGYAGGTKRKRLLLLKEGWKQS